MRPALNQHSAVLYWGFTTADLSAAVQALVRPQDVWIGKHRRCQYAIVDFQEYRLDRLHLPVPLGLHDFDWSPAQRERIQATLQRELLGWQTGPVELQQLIRFYQRWFATLLLHHGIAQVWFAYIPHEGAALILYEVAQSLGLRTRMFYQSLMANRAFLVEQVETLGKLPATPGAYPPFAETFSYGQPEQDLFYMRSLPPVLGQRAFFWRSYWPRLKARLRGKIVRLGVVALAVRQAQRRRWLARQAARQWDEVTAFAGRPMVFVPLHLQPELTTDPLGGRYGDQARFVEVLRQKLPAGVAIVLKENPKQDFEWRSEFFWQRIRRLPGVYVVDPGVNTYFLLHQAAALATVTGTAGWEGVLAGKPVIVGGAAWYQDLPGVWPLDDLPEWPVLMAFRADFVQTQQALDRLASAMPELVADLHYQVIFPGYDPADNRQRLQTVLSS